MLTNRLALQSRVRINFGRVVMWTSLIVVIGFVSYQRLFSSLASYDDEGYVMVSLKQFMAGGELYDEVYSQYGPGYFWLESAIHRLTQWPVTHDVTRFKTLAIWMSSAILAAGWLYRVTRSSSIAAIGLLFVAMHLERLAMEPGHPQEVGLMAVALCIFLSTFVQGKSSDIAAIIAMGVATGFCLMTKVNVGLFLLLSMSSALLLMARRNRTRDILLVGVIAAMIVLPIAIGRHHLFSWSGYRLPMLLTIAIGLTAWACARTAFSPTWSLRNTFWLWGSSSLTAVVVAIGTLATGTSLLGLANGIVLQHMQFVNFHYNIPPIHAFAPLAALLAVFVARHLSTSSGRFGVLRLVAAFPLKFNRMKRDRDVASQSVSESDDKSSHSKLILTVIYAATGLLLVKATFHHLVESFQPLYHGSQDVGQTGLLVSFFAPYVWIILLPLCGKARTSDAADRTRFARLSLCWIAVLQPLIASPVPGTQMAIGSLALVIAMLTAIHDGVEILRKNQNAAWRVGRRLIVGFGAMLLAIVIARGVFLSIQRSGNPSLNLAGASRLHLPDDVVAREQWTVEQLRQRADTFVCLPTGHNSLYLWSGIDPATGYNATVWQDLLPDDRQCQVIDAINRRSRVCVVVDTSESPSLRTHGPLLDFLRDNFEPVVSRGTREIWERRSSEPSNSVTLAPTISVNLPSPNRPR